MTDGENGRKGKILLSVVFFGIFVCVSACDFGTSESQNFAECRNCHQGLASAGIGHDFACEKCHLRPEHRGPVLEDHALVLGNPAGPETFRTVCGKCHAREVADFQTSLHMTLAGMVNQTRFLLGAQARAYPPVYGAGGALPLIPPPVDSPDDPADLADDLLRRRCLRCHVNALVDPDQPPYRGRGCAACHVVYAEDGRYHGRDASLDREATGRPARHGLTADIADAACLVCHRPNYTGADAHGWFERDYDSFFQEAILEGLPARERGQFAGHTLSRDLHIQRGLGCRDCHDRADVMGDGMVRGFALETPRIRCQDCHGGFREQRPDCSLEQIAGSDGVWWLTDQKGLRHRLPLFTSNTFAHDPEVHADLRCSACHAQWSYLDFGLSLLRKDSPGFRDWTYLTAQGDPGISSALQELVQTPDLAPESRDALSGASAPGIWLKGYRFRRWESRPLGRDHQGRFTIFRPRHQYRISYVNAAGTITLDSQIPERGDGLGRGWAFMPSVPHTTAPEGRSCETCHMNPEAAGQGLDLDVPSDASGMQDLGLRRPWPPVIPPMRLLQAVEQERLLQPSNRFQKRFFQVKKAPGLEPDD